MDCRKPGSDNNKELTGCNIYALVHDAEDREWWLNLLTVSITTPLWPKTMVTGWDDVWNQDLNNQILLLLSFS